MGEGVAAWAAQGEAVKLYRLVGGSALLLLLVAVSPTMANAATAPVTTISNPIDGQGYESSLAVEGTYTAEAAVSAVKVIVCTMNSNGACSLYLRSTSTGEMTATWTAHNATISNAGGTSGTYSLPITNLQLGTYRVLTFAKDATKLNGPRASVAFEVTSLAPPTVPNKSYITIMWGRSNWQATSKCVPVANARTLEENAQDLAERGLFGVGGVVTNRTHESDRTCLGYTSQPSWADLANLATMYGWKFVSQGLNYSNMTLMTTDEERYQESGSTLPVFEAHGHNDAWGAFNYPNNKRDAAAEAVVNQYFAFGRVYHLTVNDRSTVTASPYLMRTFSVNGGRCHNPSLACYDMTVNADRRTTPPRNVAAILNPRPDQWGVVQWYRIVQDARGSIGDFLAWDCTSPDWRDRWTSQPELTCRDNFLEALAGRSSEAEVTHPAAVAQAWGRVPVVDSAP